MEFVVLFILAFLFGYVIYTLSQQWMMAVGLSLGVFILSAVIDGYANTQAMSLTLIFGVPIVFFASLLGCYVVQIRSPDHLDEQLDIEQQSDN